MMTCQFNPGQNCAYAVILAALDYFVRDIERSLLEAPTDDNLQKRLADANQMAKIVREQLAQTDTPGIPLGTLSNSPALLESFSEAIELYRRKTVHDADLMDTFAAFLRTHANSIISTPSMTKH